MDLTKIKGFPREPGVYLMKNRSGRVIYVGKANNLKNRVNSYFRQRGDTRYFTRFLVSKLDDIDFIVTDTEKEALILENNLIKRYKPRYNVRFKDDKTFVSLRLGIKDKYPRLTIVRRPLKDGALYFGPYSSSQSVRKTIRTIHTIFPICTCKERVFRNRERPCFYYQIQRCMAPCINGMVTESEYKRVVGEVILFLQGKNEELLWDLKKEMKKKSDNLRFEEAGRIYNKIKAIEATLEAQKITSYQFTNQDIFGYFREGDRLAIQRLYVRDGRLEGGKGDLFSGQILPDEEILSSYINQYYSSEKFIPKEILLPVEITNIDLLSELLSEKKGERIQILCPKRGKKRDMVLLANKNAKIFLEKAKEKIEGKDELLRELQKRLSLKNLPRVIEAFDISNISGKSAVGSMVTFRDGVADKDHYRRYSIKWIKGRDDYGMMREVLLRRYKKALKEKGFPDLILIDGGKGQLNVTSSVLKELEIEEPDIISMAKGEDKRDDLYKPNRKNPIRLKGPLLFLLQRIRDEAHRFAITYHKKKRRKETFGSLLDRVPGIGIKKKRGLLSHFGSLKRIREASLDELINVKGISKRDAETLFQFLHNK
ncbi:MAG TPA: excinuclease ABC subunit UvrC [Nitrospinota bacterium]|nr:excinuclease ABC subunit UvrC [Nitrospinota bacterium]